MQIYIHREGQQSGPYAVEQLREDLASGNLLASDLAWHEGAADWLPLAQVAGVVPAASPAPEVSTPVPAPQRDWIPPRRSATSSGTLRTTEALPARVLGSMPVLKTSTAFEQAASVVPGDVNRRTRRTSSGLDGLQRRQREIGTYNMGLGAFWCIGGTAVTVISYDSATTSAGGGSYVVAWGAMLFGGIQFIKGLIQFCQA